MSIFWATRRIGLISDQIAVETLVKLRTPTRNDLKKEIDSIGDLKLEFTYKIDEKKRYEKTQMNYRDLRILRWKRRLIL